MHYFFSPRSELNLKGIHPDLERVVRDALIISPVDIIVIEGLRTAERQLELVRKGMSQTNNSRHLTGHAVDLAPLINNSIPWNEWPHFVTVANVMKKAALELKIPIVWGGDWVTLKDGPHFELSRESYL